MKKWIIVKNQFIALHRWKEAKNFIKDLHRHIFYVEIWISVDKENREIEFFEAQGKIDVILNVYLENRSLEMSCESIANYLLNHIKRWYPEKSYKCKVSEDNECGAMIEDD